jgi:hypothetical protein
VAYNADIIVRLVETEVDKAVKRIERKLQGLQNTANNVEIGAVAKGTRELKGFEKRVDAIGRSLERIKPTAAIGGISTALAAGAGGAEKLAQALQGINNLGPGFGKVTAALNSFGGSLEQAVGPAGKLGAALLDFASSAPATAAGIGLATASLFAFAPAIKQATADIFSFKNSFKNLVSSVTADGLVAFNSLNEKFEITRKGLIELAKGSGSLSFLKQELKEAKKSLDEMDSTAEEFRQETVRLIEAEKNVNNELRARKRIYDELTAQQQRIRQNVEESRASRAGTGFAARDPVAKSIRRNQQKVARELARRPKVAIDQQPLALPSSEMLDAATRGIKRIRSVSDQLGKDLDYTNQEVANFVNGLKNGANEANKLPKIFDIVNASLQEAVASTQKLKSPVFGPGNEKGVAAYKERVRLTKLAGNLDQNFTKSINSLKVKQNAAIYRLEQKRIKKLADQQKAADRERQKRAESIALGVGFPLLFGGGAGSVLGSAAGSFVGSGFGGQIVGGAIGQAVDDYIRSIGELGAALNPATADTTKLVEALGATNTPFASLVERLENSGREALALSIATQRMADLIGQEGVDALKEFGEDSTRLGNEFAKAMTLMASSVAQVINSVGLFKAIADQLGRANLINQARNSGDAEQQARFERFEQAGVGFGTGTDPLAKVKEREKIIQEIIAAQIKLNAEAAREEKVRATLAEFDGIKLRQIRGTVSEKRIELEIELLNAKANDETRIALEKKLAFQRRINKEQQLYNQYAIDEIKIGVLREELEDARLTYEKELAAIRNRAANYKPPKAGVDEEAKVQKTIAGLKAKEFELNTKLITIGANKIEKLGIEKDRLDGLLQLKRKEIELGTEDQRIKELKLKNLDKEFSILYQLKELDEERLELEKEITGIKGRQQIDNLERSLGQELAGLSLPTGDRFLDEQNQLEAKQANRYANAIQKINDQLEIQKALEKDGSEDAQIEAAAKIKLLERQRGVYERMLPQIAAAEQAQLKFNQTLELVQGPVNAFVNGLTEGLVGLIEGTKSAEEAFADMLKAMGKALIDQAAIMIAQYIAIGVARAFAGMGTAVGEQASLPGVEMGSGGGTFTNIAGNEFSTAGPNFGFRTRAVGGPVNPGGTYLVGERGPELLTMTPGGGYVTSNSSSRAAMSRYNTSNTADSTPTFRLETTVINGVEYATVDQVREMGAISAKRGAQMGQSNTMKSLQNSRSQRSRIGMR